MDGRLVLQDVWLDNSILIKLVGGAVVKVPWPEESATPTKKRAHAEMVSSRGAVASPASAEKSAKVEDALLSSKIDAKTKEKEPLDENTSCQQIPLKDRFACDGEAHL